MKQNAQIQNIKQVIAQQRDDDLQSLYQKADKAGISVLTIMQTWYGVIDLERQPKKIVDFFVRVLEKDQGESKHMCGERSKETKVNPFDKIGECLITNPWRLRVLIERNVGNLEQQAASALAVLAWMGFDEKEALDIRCADLNLVRCTIRGRQIPKALFPIIVNYNCLDGHDISPTKHYIRTRSETTGRTGRLSQARLKATMEQHGLSYENIRMSGEYYRRTQIEWDW